MIKKMLERLRRWLIVKLGGYTEQKISISREVRINANVRYRTLRANYILRKEMFQRTEERDFLAYGKNLMIEAMAKELVESDAVIMERRDDLEKGVVEIRGQVFVVEGKDAAMFLNLPWEVKG